MDFDIAQKRGHRDHLPLVVYKNLMHVWRGARAKKRAPQEAVDYIRLVKTKKPQIYRGFIQTIRIMSKNQLRPFGRCDHEGCRETSTIDCRIYHGKGEETRENLCWQHAIDAGYCPGCGNFWAGTEYFDFNLGGAHMCQDCTDTFKYELGEYDDEEFDDWGDFHDFDDYEDDYEGDDY